MASSIAQTIIHIDGGFCEGGGQLLRNAVTLSTLLSKPISISNVRRNRRPPGLRRQHETGTFTPFSRPGFFSNIKPPSKLLGINLAASICNAETKGVEVGSTEIEFCPNPIQLPTMVTADTGTAGSTTLLLQVALPCLLFCHPSEFPTSQEEGPTSVLTLLGGTNAALAPQIDYTQSILFPFLSKHFRISPTLTINRRGYYPKGGGSVLCTTPSIAGPLPPVVLTERGQVTAIRGGARVGGLPLWIAQRMVSGAHRTLLQSGIPSSEIAITSVRERDEDVVGAGGSILLWAETDKGCLIAGSAVSTREKKPETVGEEAARELVKNLHHGGCVDEYLQDQMIIFLALAKGTSIVKVGPLTDHTRYVDSCQARQHGLMRDRTAIHIAQLLTGARFHLDENVPNSTMITCEGIGFTPSLPSATRDPTTH